MNEENNQEDDRTGDIYIRTPSGELEKLHFVPHIANNIPIENLVADKTKANITVWGYTIDELQFIINEYRQLKGQNNA